MLNRSLSVAPMLDWTDRHCRYFMRLLSRHAVLYTEMVTMQAVLRGKRDLILRYNPEEHPIALQIGGNDPSKLAECAKIGADYGYDEINFNVGCPSDRVQSGQFGACLMLNPELVAQCVSAMCNAVSIPITVKTRIGVDDHDSYEELVNFVNLIAQAGCNVFIIHARKAWLKGLSPKENREIPVLRYDIVQQLKKDFPHLQIILNGGITTVEQIKHHLKQVDGIMLGRAAYRNSYLVALAEQAIFSTVSIPTREAVLKDFMLYVEQQQKEGVKPLQMTRHILGLFRGEPGVRAWRRAITFSSVSPQFS